MTGWFIAGAMVLTLGFSRSSTPWRSWPWRTIYSHILLVPWITLYLIWIKRKDLAEDDRGQRTEGAERKRAWLAVVLLALGLGAILAYGLLGSRHPRLPRNDSLALATLSYVSFLLSGCLWMFGFRTVRRFAFPLGFLLVLVPWPTAVTHGAAVFLQYASAEAAHLLLQISGTTVFRQGLTFHLPGIALTVAEECSGIRSTLVLLVTSMLAGYLFLDHLETAGADPVCHSPGDPAQWIPHLHHCHAVRACPSQHALFPDSHAGGAHLFRTVPDSVLWAAVLAEEKGTRPERWLTCGTSMHIMNPCEPFGTQIVLHSIDL